MARITKVSPLLNLNKYSAFIIESEQTSQYLGISELGDIFTAGKNGFLIEGTEYLKSTTQVKIEVLDVEGNPLYVEPGQGIPEYYEGLSKLVSAHVYQSTPIGLGKITILCELENYIDENGFITPVPEEWRGVYNLKWERAIKINKNIANEDRVRFVRRPEIKIKEIGDRFYIKESAIVSINGQVRGIPDIPGVDSVLRQYPGNVRYFLRRVDGDFPDGITSISVDGTNIQNVDVVEYLNQSTIVIGIPFVDASGRVQSFSQRQFSAQKTEVQSIEESSIFGSFGRFEINNLTTFVGDVERIKVSAKSQATTADYELIHDTRVDSAEILSVVMSGSVESIGMFTSSYLNGLSYEDYWNVSGEDFELDSSQIYKSIKLRNATVSSSLDGNISLEKGSEYTLEFYVYYSSSLEDTSDSLSVFLTSTEKSGSNVANYFITTSIVDIPGKTKYRTAQKISTNFIPNLTDNWTLNFKANNSSTTHWQVGSVSLVGSNELGYSPDEFVFTIPIERQLESETFDFKLEYFDINNNFIPIESTAVETFQGGNIYLLGRSLEVDLDRQFFTFDALSMPSPETQSVNIFITKNLIQGNLLITSQAFDTGGIFIDPIDVTGAYPGYLTSYTENEFSASAILSVESFIGSSSPTVDRILYTVQNQSVSAPIIKRFTIGRVGEGDSGVSVDLTKEAVTFAANSLGEVADYTIGSGEVSVTYGTTEASFNLTNTTPNSYRITSVSGNGATPTSGAPTTPEYGITNMTQDSASLALVIEYTAPDGSTLINFNKSVSYSKARRAAPILNFLLSPIDQTVPALSTGKQSGSFANVTGSVTQTYEGITNTILPTITYASASSTIFVGSQGVTFSTNNIQLSEKELLQTSDSGVVIVRASVEDAEGSIRPITGSLSVANARKAAPSTAINVTSQTQIVSASADYSDASTPLPVTVSLSEAGLNYIYDDAIPYDTGSFRITGVTGATNNNNGSIQPNTPTTAAGTNGVITLSYVNSEGTTITGQTLNFSVGVVAPGEDGVNGASGSNAVTIQVTPAQQNVSLSTTGSYGTPFPVRIVVIEDGDPLTYDNTLANPGTFRVQGGVTNGSNISVDGITSGSIQPTTPTTPTGIVTDFNIRYRNLAGDTSSDIPQTHIVTVTLDGQTGPGIVFTGVWEPDRIYQFSTGSTGRRDAVLWSSTGNQPYDTYYGTLRQHTSINTNTLEGPPSAGNQTGWETLGTQSLFVAAKIGIFEDSFVQNTLNIGTSTTGSVSSANITIAGATNNPYISIGQSSTTGSQGYNLTGIFLGQDAGKAKFSLSGSEGSLSWNGNNLSVDGTGKFSGRIEADEGNIGGWEITDTELLSPDTSMSFNSVESNASITISGLTAIDRTIIKAGEPSLIEIDPITIGNLPPVSIGDATYSGDPFFTDTLPSAPTTFVSQTAGVYSMKFTASAVSPNTVMVSSTDYTEGIVGILGVLQFSKDDFATIQSSTIYFPKSPIAAEDGTRVWVMPGISREYDGQFSVNLEGSTPYKVRSAWVISGEFGSGTITAQSSSFTITGLELGPSANVTEISAGGIQIVKSNNAYVQMLTSDETYRIKVVGAVSASTYHGDGSNLTGLDTGGTVTSVNAVGGGTGLSFTGGPITAAGTLTLGGTLLIGSGGTGATTAAAARANLVVPTRTGGDASGEWQISITGQAGSVNQSITFNNSGAGVSSGTTFNGSVARTISYNTIGAAAISHTMLSHTATNWRVFYSNGTSNVQELVLGAAGTYLRSAGTSSAPAFATIAGSEVTGAALTKADDTNVTLTLSGAPSIALLRATSISLGWTGQLAVSRGGTGQSSYTNGQLLIGNTTGGTLQKSTLTGTTNRILITNGPGTITITADASSTNDVNKIVARDSSGNFSANVITASLNGNLNLQNRTTNENGYITFTGTTATGTQPQYTQTNLRVNPNLGGMAARTLFIGVTSPPSYGIEGVIRATGDIVGFYSSDIRLKENILPIKNSLNKIEKIRGVNFDWTDTYIKDNGGEDGYFVRKHDIGVIAQEIEQVLPEAVATRENGYKAVRYEKIVPLLIEAIKDLHTQIKELKERIDNK